MAAELLFPVATKRLGSPNWWTLAKPEGVYSRSLSLRITATISLTSAVPGDCSAEGLMLILKSLRCSLFGKSGAEGKNNNATCFLSSILGRWLPGFT